MIRISSNVSIPLDQIDFIAIRAQGAGGQNVNKVSSAIHLRFDVRKSTLPNFYKEELLALKDSRLSKDGVIVLKAQKFRTQLQNRVDAIERLQDLVKGVGLVQKARRQTRPTKASKTRRLDGKARRGKTKALRGRVVD